MTKGKFVATFGPCKIVVEGDTTLDARLEATRQLRSIGARLESPEAIQLRLVSGFPRLTEHDLKLGETVVKGDLFPLQDSPGWVQIDHEEQLDAMVRRWPVGVEAIPPFRVHARSKGQWRIPEFDEDRRRASATIAGHLELDRQAGFGCD
jgi:hypothetical protein